MQPDAMRAIPLPIFARPPAGDPLRHTFPCVLPQHLIPSHAPGIAAFLPALRVVAVRAFSSFSVLSAIGLQHASGSLSHAVPRCRNE